VLTDLYGAGQSSNANIYQSPTLSLGYHTIRVRVTGQKNAAATGSAVAIDKLVVY
jgi:hypothetical protein